MQERGLLIISHRGPHAAARYLNSERGYFEQLKSYKLYRNGHQTPAQRLDTLR